jgi:hypothetical protein
MSPRSPAERFCRARRAKRGDDALVPVAFEVGVLSGAFALTFQLAVSFGHVHLELITPVAADASVLASTQASGDDSNVPSSPPGREDLADDCCPICTLIHLAGALVLTPRNVLLPALYIKFSARCSVSKQRYFSDHIVSR